jgi:Kdo2-lipid IVA lauroyltransferase/acyltransferase
MAVLVRLRERAEWLAVNAVLLPTRLFPAIVLRGGTRFLALVLSLLAWRRRARTHELVCARLGLGRGSAEASRIVRGSFQTLLRNAIEPELLDRRRRARGTIADLVEVQGREHLQAAREAGRGVMLCTGHIGTWEALGLALQSQGEQSWCIARVLDNPLLERQLAARRQAMGKGSIPKDGGGLRLMRVLRDGDLVVALLDQNAGQHGALLDFLGETASQHTVAGVMARRAGAAALPTYLLPAGPGGRLRLVFEPAVQADEGLDDDEAVLQITRRLSDSLERQVRAHPEQWLWLHDRWRHARYAIRTGRAVALPPPAEAGANRMAAAQGTNGP